MDKNIKSKLIEIYHLGKDIICEILGALFPRTFLKLLTRHVYSYHNIGYGIIPEEEKTPCGSGERYNFDRMYMMVSNYNFTNKNILDLGCNSGWFCVQCKFIGSNITVGIDHSKRGILGNALRYAKQLEKVMKLGITYINQDLEQISFKHLLRQLGIQYFDTVLLLSVLHHIGEENMAKKTIFFSTLYDVVKDVIFYEDHEFWNEMYDNKGIPIKVLGKGYQFGWNEDLSWQRKIGSIEFHEPIVLSNYMNSWRKEVLLFDRFKQVKLLGFSEKRRPMLALFK